MYNEGQPRCGDFVVCRPRRTDAVGQALRGIFSHVALPDDMQHLVRRLDRVSH